MAHKYSRSTAERDLKETAQVASEHSSGTILNAPDPNSSYAHVKMERSGSVNANTTMPTTQSTIDGAYSIGSTDASGVAANYDNQFTTPATEVVSGSGSRTVQALPEQVQDRGTTVQTQKITRAVIKESSPVTYIPPATTTSQTVGTASTIYTTGEAYPTRAVANQGTIGGTFESTSTQQASTVGATTTHSGIPHSPASHTLAQDSTQTGAEHTSTTGAAPHKESMMSKLKHVFKK